MGSKDSKYSSPNGSKHDVETTPNRTKEDAEARKRSIAFGAHIEEEYRDMPMLEKVIIMTSLCLSVFLAALDQSIISTALPVISQHFGTTAGYTWIGAAYNLGNAASVPSWGKISDIFGRKPVLLAAAGLFFIGSVIAAVSVNVAMLIAGRGIQGVGGGGVIALVNICISDLFSTRDRGAYYGLIGMTWAFASSCGPLIGGAFTEKASWRWCFYINLPTSGFAMVILAFFLKVKNPRTPFLEGLKAIDWVGSLLVVAGTVMFLLGLQLGGVTHPWGSAIVLCLIIFGLFSLTLFVLYEWKVAEFPITPMNLFTHRTRVAAFSVGFSHGMAFIAGVYYLPVFFQSVLLARPLLSGVYLLPFCLALSLGSAGTGVIIQKTGKYNPIIRTGFAFMTLGFGLFIDLKRTSGWAKIIIFQIIAGIGCGPQFQGPLIALHSVVEGRNIATATSTFQFIRNLATSISVVIGGVLYQNGIKTHQSELESIIGNKTIAGSFANGAPGANINILHSLPLQAQLQVRDVMAKSLDRMWYFYVAIVAVGFLLTFMIGTHELSRTRNPSVSNNGRGVSGSPAATDTPIVEHSENIEGDIEKVRSREISEGATVGGASTGTAAPASATAADAETRKMA